MSRSKSNRQLWIILGVLAATAVGKKLMDSREYESGDRERAAQEMFAELAAADVAEFSVSMTDVTTELSKDGDQWVVTSAGGFRADATAVEKAITALDELKHGLVVSRRSDQFNEYELDEERAIHVTAKNASGEVLADFFIGKESDDYRSTFLRCQGRDDVHKVDDPSIRRAFDRSSQGGWRDLTIFDGSVEADAVRRLTVVKNDELMLEFEKVDVMGETPPPEDGGESSEDGDGAGLEVKESVWNLVHPVSGRAVKYLVDGMARTLTDSKAEGFFDSEQSSAELGLDPPVYVLTAEFEGGSHVLWMGEKDAEGRYPCTTSTDEVVWLLNGWRGDNFAKDAEDFLDKAAAEPSENPGGSGDADPASASDDAGEDDAGEDDAGEDDGSEDASGSGTTQTEGEGS